MAVEDADDVVAQGSEGFVAGIGAGEGAVAGEQERGGDGADGGGAAEGRDEPGVGRQADGEFGAEGRGFGGELGDGPVVDHDADEDEAAVVEFLLQAVPAGDGAAAGGIVGAEEDHELDLAGVLGGFDFAGEFGGEVFQDEIGNGRRGAEIDGRRFLLAAAGGQEQEAEDGNQETGDWGQAAGFQAGPTALRGGGANFASHGTRPWGGMTDKRRFWFHKGHGWFSVSASWKAGGGSFLGLMIFSFRNFSSWRTRFPSPVASFLTAAW